MTRQLSDNNIRLAIVCPMANEKLTAENFIKDVLNQCRSFRFQKIRFFAIVDQMSRDGTREILASLSQGPLQNELEVVFAPQNKNVVDAYQRGYREALANDYDWILEIDAGYSHQPADIPKFFNLMLTGEYDCVFGSRFVGGGRIIGGSWMYSFVRRWGTVMINVLVGSRLSDMLSGFELFRHEALKEILETGIHSTGPFFQTEIRTHAHHFRIAEVPIHYYATSHHLHRSAVADAFKNLYRLILLRCRKEGKG